MLVADRQHPVHPMGVQKIHRFCNDYGASVVIFPFSYGVREGLWELAVLHFNSKDNLDFTLDYDTPLTDGVLGWLTDEAVEETLKKIEALPRWRKS